MSKKETIESLRRELANCQDDLAHTKRCLDRETQRADRLLRHLRVTTDHLAEAASDFARNNALRAAYLEELNEMKGELP